MLFRAWNCINNSIIVLLVKIVDRTTLASPILKFNSSSFTFPFINFICKIENMDVFEHLWLDAQSHLWEKQPPSWTHCSVVNRILEKPYQKRSFQVTLLVYCCEFIYRLFLTHSQNFGRIFFRQLCLAASLGKECSTNKNIFIIIILKEKLRRDVFHFGTEDLK